jgi:hypothetical protein
MCHYVTAVLPGSANHAALAEIAARHGRTLEPQQSPSVEAELRTGERYFLTTRGHCDCGTALGALNEAETRLQHRARAAEDEELKLRRKGWSEAKITRWKEQKSEQLARPQTVPDATDWEQLLKDMLSSRQTSSVALLLHWYNGPIEARIHLHGRQVVRLADLTSDLLGRMREDVLYEFQE